MIFEFYVVGMLLVAGLCWHLFGKFGVHSKFEVHSSVHDTNNGDMYDIVLLESQSVSRHKEILITPQTLFDENLAFAEERDMMALLETDRYLPQRCSISSQMEDGSVWTIHCEGISKRSRTLHKNVEKLPRSKHDLIAVIDIRTAKTKVSSNVELFPSRATS